MLKVAVLMLAFVGSAAWTPMAMSAESLSRRQMFKAASILAPIIAAPSIVRAKDLACPAGVNNCVEGYWKPPSGTSSSDAVASLKSVLEAYPQEGQASVDGGGWKLVEDTSSYLRLEFRSSGKGNFAKFLNGGKPFVDDLEIALDNNGAKFKSASRAGDSDFGVNGKRVEFIKKGLVSKGWVV
mmetsp:Transcript_1227/g.2369  ORF Transcript_1227/g.2369 Transcript_1227/m.2369 type:complete len:183 (-) Transcript_1227:245-793(-)